MPFTLSHPAAAVPLARFGLPLSALVMGSMAPDFPYFVNIAADSHYGHTLPGIFLLSMPAGFVALSVFHVLLKLPVLSLLPASHQARLGDVAHRFKFGPPRQFLLIMLALLLGAVSHVLWDSCTHAHGWTVRHVPVLHAPLLQFAFGGILFYRVLQHASTVAGGTLLVYWYARWFEQTPARPSNVPFPFPKSVKIGLICVMGIVAACTGLANGFIESQQRATTLPQVFALHATLAAVCTAVAEIVVFSLIWHWDTWRRSSVMG